MPSMTVVTLLDEDDDEFPIALPGVFRENRGADIQAAVAIAAEGIRDGKLRPNGELRLGEIEYVE